METIRKLSFLLTSLTIVLSISTTISESPIQNFLNCFSHYSQSLNSSISNVIYTPNNPSFLTILNRKIHNKRFKTATTPKPLAIITAKDSSHVQVTILCAKSSNIQIRIRSGGHDYEGYSYISDVAFVILDMFHLNSVDVNLQEETAWVESGATLGKIYYTIAKTNNSFAFPSGVCFSVGAGGQLSSGGYGNLMRKFGLSIDNTIDAKIVDVNGKILDRKSMGEDLFWAIRGGGGASFGVIILSWKLKLLHIPPQVTVFNVKMNVNEGATDVVYKWQLIAPKLHKDLFIRVQPNVVPISYGGKKVVQVSFIGQFLGTVERLLPIVSENFPELDLKKSDCLLMPWINSTFFWYDKPIGTPLETMLNEPNDPQPNYFKGKSDYVKKPISKEAIESIWKLMLEGDTLYMQWNPYGGKMEEILPSKTPFPHRAGNLFLIQYINNWTKDESTEAIERHMNFSRLFHKFMTPYVFNCPREAFLNYRDSDIGANHPSNVTKFDIARIYGNKYFKGNFERLVSVKTKVDPENFFRFEQSIPTTTMS